MTKSDYENLLKRIEKNLIKNSKAVDDRFELPPVDVMWEGQRTYLRNFSEYPPIDKISSFFIITLECDRVQSILNAL